MNTSSRVSSSGRKARFNYQGVTVSFNETEQGNWEGKGRRFVAVRAYQDLPHFDEASQVRLVKRYAEQMRGYFTQDALGWVENRKNPARGWAIRCICPDARKVLARGLPKNTLDALPVYVTPRERLLLRIKAKAA